MAAQDEPSIYDLFESRLAKITDPGELSAVLLFMEENRSAPAVADLFKFVDPSSAQTASFVKRITAGDAAARVRWKAYELIKDNNSSEAAELAGGLFLLECARQDDFSRRAGDALLTILRRKETPQEERAVLEQAYRSGSDARRKAYVLLELASSSSNESRDFVARVLAEEEARGIMDELFRSGGALHENQRAFLVECYLTNANPTIRLRAIEEVGLLPTPRARRLLEQVARSDPDEEVRRAAELKLK